MNKTEFKKLMNIQGGFSAKEKQGKTILGCGGIRTAYSTVSVMESEKNYVIFCDVENEQGKNYHNFGETVIEISKLNNDLKMVFTVSDENGHFVVESNDIDGIIFSGYFSEKAKEYVKEICKLIFTINKGV